MPYASVSELPAPVKTKLKGKKLRQWMHVFNSAFKEHQSESIAFASAWAAVRKGEAGYTALEKAEQMTDFNFFLPIAKIDQEKRTVSGYASTPTKDSDGEIVSLDAIKMALPSYLEYGNIREMHALKAVGVAAETNVDKKGLFLTAYISDDQAWKKCLPVKMADVWLRRGQAISRAEYDQMMASIDAARRADRYLPAAVPFKKVDPRQVEIPFQKKVRL